MADAAQVPDNFIVLDFGDGEYEFRLPVGQIGELQTKCEAGVGKIYARLMAGRFLDRDNAVGFDPRLAEFKYEDVVEVIRLSLIGGGMSPTDALAMVRNYVHTRPLMENWRVAAAALSAFLIGYEDPDAEPKKKAKAKPTVKGGST